MLGHRQAGGHAQLGDLGPAQRLDPVEQVGERPDLTPSWW
jgi:hypothetical protein